MTRVYVAGPMTGLPDYNLRAFAEAAAALRDVGHDAVNPGRHGVIEGYTWHDYMRRGLAELLTCEGIALLPGWPRSRGARAECDVALALDMDVRTVPEWLAAGRQL